MNRFWKFPFFIFDAPDAGGGGGSEFSSDMDILNSTDDEGEGEGEGEPEGDEDPEPETPDVGDPDLPILEEGDEDADAEIEELPGDEGGKGKDVIPPADGAEGEGDEDDKGKKEPEPIEGRPTIKQLKEVFPNLFKVAPELKGIYFREKQFSEVFDTPETARDAAMKAENYEKLEDSLVQGDPTLIIQELGQHNRPALQKLCENWLPKLREADESLYARVTTPVIEDLIYYMNEAGKRQGDENMQRVARHVANFVFANGGEVPDITKRNSGKPHPAEEQLNKERQEHARRVQQEADLEINTRVSTALETAILKDLDPTNKLTERQKKALVRDVKEEINAALVKDQAHGRRMQGLWTRAQRASFSRQGRDSIVNGYLSAVRPIIRGIRTRVLTEYLGQSAGKGKGPQAGNNNQQGQQSGKKRGTFVGNRQASVNQQAQRRAVLDPSKIDYARTSDADILSDDPRRVKLRK